MNTNDNKLIVRIIIVIIFAIFFATALFSLNHYKKEVPINNESTNVKEEITEEPIAESNPELINRGIIHDTKFGGVYIDISIPEFNELGFEYGDSLNVDFSNGFSAHDIPYYNGYYVDYGEMLLVAYPGYDYIRFGINFGDDLWVTQNLSEDDTCSITINEKAKYMSIQKVRDIKYTDEQGDIPNEVFGNFREMTVGNLKEKMVYRGASPIDNKHNRAPVVDKLIEKENVKYIIDLADDEDEIAEFSNGEDFDSPYFMKLLNDGKVVLLSMEANFKSDTFKEKLVYGLTEASKNDGPYYIHCQEGKDRTGYVCMLVDALAGASFDEVVDDYMITYDNYYGITLESDPERYDLIKKQNIDEMVKYVTGLEDIKDIENVDLQKCVEDYLVSIGMKQEDLKTLQAEITK